MITIKGAVGLAKHAMNRIIIAITNCYQTAVGKASYLTIANAEIHSQQQTPCITAHVLRKNLQSALRPAAASDASAAQPPRTASLRHDQRAYIG